MKSIEEEDVKVIVKGNLQFQPSTESAAMVNIAQKIEAAGANIDKDNEVNQITGGNAQKAIAGKKKLKLKLAQHETAILQQLEQRGIPNPVDQEIDDQFSTEKYFEYNTDSSQSDKDDLGEDL